MPFKYLLLLVFIFTMPVSKTYAGKIPRYVQSYYNLINKAELAIIDNDYKNAARYYIWAFKQKYPNGKDLENAFLVALSDNDSVLAKKYFDKLVQKGFHFIEEDWSKFPHIAYVTSSFDSLYEYSHDHPNIKQQVAVLDSMLANDRNPRMIDPEDPDAIVRADSLNIKMIIDYVHKYGFPDFEQVGYFPRRFDYGREGAIWYVLWHNRLWYDDGKRHTVSRLIENAVQNGQYSPTNWTFIQSAGNRESKTDTTDRLHLFVKYDEVIDKKQLRRINKRRREQLMNSYADYRKILYYEIAQIKLQKENGRSVRFHFLNEHIPAYIIEINAGTYPGQ